MISSPLSYNSHVRLSPQVPLFMEVAPNTPSKEHKERTMVSIKIREVIDLGKKIQTYDYSKECSEWGDKHCAHVVLIHRKSDNIKDEPLHKIVCWRNSENSENVEDRLEQFFSRKKVQQWAEENGYDMEDLQISYSGEWDSKDNYKVWKQLFKKAQKAEQDDIDKFFKLIARNYKTWWW